MMALPVAKAGDDADGGASEFVVPEVMAVCSSLTSVAVYLGLACFDFLDGGCDKVRMDRW